MRLKSLSLQNFRNLENILIKFDKETTVLIGDNAQGKTNFLESVYFLATGKPIKTETDIETIKFGESSVNVEGNLKSTENEEGKISTIIQNTEQGLRKRFLVNGIPRRMVDYQGNLVVVFFRPEDIELVTGSPSFRREYIDQTIGQVDREYRKVLNSYQKIITQKNKLLKLIREGLAKSDELIFWNDEQLRLGIILQSKRQNFFETINSFEKKFGYFEYKYLPNLISESRLQELNSREVQAAISLAGPHRDDFQFFLDEKDLAKYGSRGEQRTAVLDLKITELSYFEKIIGARPVLLLDDIFSELDVLHRQHVLDLAKLQQTIIATVEYDEYLKEALKMSQVLKVKNGIISS
jgi:DNA replication and repair protein RecF